MDAGEGGQSLQKGAGWWWEVAWRDSSLYNDILASQLAPGLHPSRHPATGRGSTTPSLSQTRFLEAATEMGISVPEVCQGSASGRAQQRGGGRGGEKQEEGETPSKAVGSAGPEAPGPREGHLCLGKGLGARSPPSPPPPAQVLGAGWPESGHALPGRSGGGGGGEPGAKPLLQPSTPRRVCQLWVWGDSIRCRMTGGRGSFGLLPEACLCGPRGWKAELRVGEEGRSHPSTEGWGSHRARAARGSQEGHVPLCCPVSLQGLLLGTLRLVPGTSMEASWRDHGGPERVTPKVPPP